LRRPSLPGQIAPPSPLQDLGNEFFVKFSYLLHF
jgi:hypothetical protein